MHRFRLFSVWVRSAILLAGIVLCGICSARAQERPLDTVRLFRPHADTVRLGFDEVLPLSATRDTKFHYLYRWASNGKRVGEENVLNYSFTGERKAKVIGRRFSTPHPWPGEEYIDMEYFTGGAHYYDFMDTVYLKAFSEYESDSTATWIWIITKRFIEQDTLFGPRIKVSSPRDQQFLYENSSVSVKCILRTETEEKHTSLKYISFKSHNLWSIRLTDSTEGSTKSIDMYNWHFGRIYAHQDDTLYLDSMVEMEEDYYQMYVSWRYRDESYETPSLLVSFDGSQYRESVSYERERRLGSTTERHSKDIYIYWGIDPDAEIETDSIWVFFPQYPYSNLGGRVDICLPHDAPLPADSDTVQVFNLGPWNRELEYVEYAWFDGTKTSSGGDSIVGRDSVFYYTFGKMDSVNPHLYAGTLVTRVKSASLWQDSCNCFVQCTDDACHRYDTVQIYLSRLPLREQNFFLPQDTTICAHLDLELQLPEEATDYHCFWLDRDSVALPYGYDTARYTVQGMRGLDGYGAGTDTREPRFFQLRLDHKLCGVSYFDTLLVYDQVKPAFELACHDTLICLDEPVEIDSLSPHVYRPFYVFAWNDGTKGSGYTFTDSGLYTLQFFVGKDFAVCGYDTASDTIRVRWSDPAQTLITLSDTSFCEKLSVTLDARVPFPTTLYCWQDGPIPNPEEVFEDEEDTIIFTSPVKVFKEEGTYNISLFDTMGCINRKEIAITIDDCSPKLDIPNVFTPNGDGVNDVWKFKQLEWCVDVKVEVVDRWGQPVLKTKVATADDFEWNGTINNKGRRLPDGPYFYMVTYKDVYGKSKVQSGSITILGTSE